MNNTYDKLDDEKNNDTTFMCALLQIICGSSLFICSVIGILFLILLIIFVIFYPIGIISALINCKDTLCTNINFKFITLNYFICKVNNKIEYLLLQGLFDGIVGLIYFCFLLIILFLIILLSFVITIIVIVFGMSLIGLAWLIILSFALICNPFNMCIIEYF